MKRMILILGMFLCMPLVYSQVFLETNKTWNVLDVAYDFSGSVVDSTYSTVVYKIEGDSLIDEKSYKKVYKTHHTMLRTEWELEAFVREDAEQKVWLRRLSDSEESLMYDFGAAQGDELSLGSYSFTVDSVKAVEIEGVSRTKLWISKADYRGFWISGIGSDKGFYSNAFDMTGGNAWMLCVKQEETTIYTNPNYGVCELNSGIEALALKSLKLYPNPAQEYIRLEYQWEATAKPLLLEVISTEGRLLYKQTLSAQDSKVNISVSSWASGFYYVNLISEGQRIRSLKLSVE